MRVRLIGLGALLATTSIHATPATFAPAKLYVQMFVDGTKVVLHGNRAEYEPNRLGGREMTTRHVKVECSVSTVRSGADAVVADLTCSKEMGALAATYGATAKGLYRIESSTQVAATAASVEANGYIVMPVAPQLGTVTRATTPDVVGSEVVVTPRNGGFCFQHTMLVGDHHQNRYCFAAGNLIEFGAEDDSSLPVVIHLERQRRQ